MYLFTVILYLYNLRLGTGIDREEGREIILISLPDRERKETLRERERESERERERDEIFGNTLTSLKK